MPCDSANHFRLSQFASELLNETMSILILETAQNLRTTIERAKSGNAGISWLPRFPENCCNFAANLLLIELSEAGRERLRRMLGTVQDNRGDDLASHVWVQQGDLVVDIAADQFEQPKVIVEHLSSWHNSLHDVKPFLPKRDLAEGVSEAEIARLREVYEEVLRELAPFR